MARLSLWNPNKGADYTFFDRTINEQIQVGGVGTIIHKYVGPADTNVNDPSQPNYSATGTINETSIQDLLLLETRDRKFDKDLYTLKGVYQVSDNDFDLTAFGLFLTSDTLYMEFHANNMIDVLGRKLMNGDVIEMPHLIDEFALDVATPPIPKFYVVQDGNRGSAGFSASWWSHIWRVKIGPITNSQEFDDILGQTADPNSMKNVFSTFPDAMNISTAIVDSAAQNDPIGGGSSLTSHLANFVDNTGNVFKYNDNIPSGSIFPTGAVAGDMFIRMDFTPFRLFVMQGSKWVRLYDNVNDNIWSSRTFNASTFVNNTTVSALNSGPAPERQSLADAILPKPNFKPPK
jgi:hypothetical protein